MATCFSNSGLFLRWVTFDEIADDYAKRNPFNSEVDEVAATSENNK